MSRHSVSIIWSKGQDLVLEAAPPVVTFVQQTVPRLGTQALSSIVTMIDVATPDSKQSEAYVSTVALFCLFSTSPKEDKLYLRLPATWRELWAEFIDFRKLQTDGADRETVKSIRKVVRQYYDTEDEDGVVFSAALRGGIGGRDRSQSRQGSRDISQSPFQHKIPILGSALRITSICFNLGWDCLCLASKMRPFQSLGSRK
jgi:ATP-dependent RNA helicase DHX29